eukprot:CAMPEP_0180182890 /NCGR_PEP_ID=MMETSP0986-20121125/40907_1 /TAXON_ID=697907 /ORGANISM="non described non described, Strain CCMP2293" /LENGTH=63 /DNA_ID=CAMNT_0022136289 /DNA_START=162 /DNA_END=353 /DNA_ORIENTATION=-
MKLTDGWNIWEGGWRESTSDGRVQKAIVNAFPFALEAAVNARTAVVLKEQWSSIAAAISAHSV